MKGSTALMMWIIAAAAFILGIPIFSSHSWQSMETIQRQILFFEGAWGHYAIAYIVVSLIVLFGLAFYLADKVDAT